MREDPNISTEMLFGDEANYYVNGEVNGQNLCYWSNGSPHWMSPTKVQGDDNVMLWSGILGDIIKGPFSWES